MNVKSVTPNLVPLEGVVKNDSAERVRFQDTADRDANGKQEHSQKEEESHRFSEEDWQEAIEKLKKLSSAGIAGLWSRDAVGKLMGVSFAQDHCTGGPKLFDRSTIGIRDPVRPNVGA